MLGDHATQIPTTSRTAPPDTQQALADIASSLDILAALLTDRIDGGAEHIVMPTAEAQALSGDLSRHAATLRSIAGGRDVYGK